ncbi:hypothetical protein SAMN06295905_0551 [Devosia lucknowensis]|uniref:Uncharacterized protein n=1 Tax=Devosia lucknowensis TaxID=1096929 RepID=A0A1Y6EGZ1_9HYPH|nr:hypothetical protein [Devosia lucknowensis]SMQ61649.1 hypothetical protein SAMN06295905_0551 [Devosia lucknowensis]
MFRHSVAAAAILAVLSTAATAQEPTDFLGVAGPISLGDTQYVLAWSSNPQPGYIKQEYIPAGDTLETYNSMVMVEFVATDAPIADVVAGQAAAIDQRKATDPIANMAMFSNPDTGEVLLDFLRSAKDEAGEYIIEWNGYRYAEAEFDGEEGVLLFAVSDRSYGNAAAEPFLRGLADFKAARLEALTSAALPALD